MIKPFFIYIFVFLLPMSICRLTSTETDSDIAFLPYLNLGAAGVPVGGLEGPEPGVVDPEEQSTVFCRGNLSLVSFSPKDACRNHGSEIFRLVGHQSQR